MFYNKFIKTIILGCSLTSFSNGFINPIKNYNLQHKINHYKLTRFDSRLFMSNITNTHKNISNIYKINFNNDEDNDWFNKPKYAFNMTEYDFTILKIYIYTIITIYCICLMVLRI